MSVFGEDQGKNSERLFYGQNTPGNIKGVSVTSEVPDINSPDINVGAESSNLLKQAVLNRSGLGSSQPDD